MIPALLETIGVLSLLASVLAKIAWLCDEHPRDAKVPDAVSFQRGARALRRSMRTGSQHRKAERGARRIIVANEARIVVHFTRHPAREVIAAGRVGDIGEAWRVRRHHARGPVEPE